MAARTVLWHVGPADLGTSFLAHALDEARADLADRGVLVPGSPEGWRRAVAEVTRTHRELGLRSADVAGAAQDLTRRLWRHKGVSLLSTPSLAPADAAQAALAVDGLQGADVQLVLVVRDLRSQVGAAAQAALLGGATTRPRRYADRVLTDAEHDQARAFADGHDLPALVERWRAATHARRVHVIATSDPAEIWTSLLGLAGVDDVPMPVAPDPALDAAGLDLLREVALGLDDLEPSARGRALRTVLPPAGGGAPLSIDGKAGRAALERWQGYLDGAGRDGVALLGTLRLERTPADAGRDPGLGVAATLAEAAHRIAALQDEVDRLTEENRRLDRKRRKHKRRLQELRRRGAA